MGTLKKRIRHTNLLGKITMTKQNHLRLLTIWMGQNELDDQGHGHTTGHLWKVARPTAGLL